MTGWKMHHRADEPDPVACDRCRQDPFLCDQSGERQRIERIMQLIEQRSGVAHGTLKRVLQRFDD